jgi:hypothetical protein
MHKPQPEPQANGHRDRSLGLTLFGAVEILIALGCAALIPLTVAAGAVVPGMDMLEVLPSLATIAIMAAVFLTLGIGSIRARVWAQALSLSLSWIWLITGIASILITWVAAPGLWFDLAASAGLEGGAARIAVIGVNLVLSFIYVLLPGAFVLFYRSPSVIATCRARDRRPGWAGRCPQRLLALAVVYALSGVSVLAMPAYNFVFPLFGLFLTGAAGAACWAVVLALSGALAYGTCRGEPWAWWTGVAATIAATVSSVASFAFSDPDRILEAMQLPADQLVLMEQLWPREPWAQIVFWLAVWGSLLAYLFVVKPLFNPPLGQRKNQT